MALHTPFPHPEHPHSAEQSVAATPAHSSPQVLLQQNPNPDFAQTQASHAALLQPAAACAPQQYWSQVPQSAGHVVQDSSVTHTPSPQVEHPVQLAAHNPLVADTHVESHGNTQQFVYVSQTHSWHWASEQPAVECAAQQLPAQAPQSCAHKLQDSWDSQIPLPHVLHDEHWSAHSRIAFAAHKTFQPLEQQDVYPPPNSQTQSIHNGSEQPGPDAAAQQELAHAPQSCGQVTQDSGAVHFPSPQAGQPQAAAQSLAAA